MFGTFGDKGDKVYVKLNIAAIVSQAMVDQGATGTDAIIALIDQILGGDGAVATIKVLTKSVTSSGAGKGIKISDVTVAVLLGWVKHGIPLNVKGKIDTHIFTRHRHSFQSGYSS